MTSDTESASRFVRSRCLLERHDRTEEVNVITVGLSARTHDDLGTRMSSKLSPTCRGVATIVRMTRPPKVDPLSG